MQGTYTQKWRYDKSRQQTNPAGSFPVGLGYLFGGVGGYTDTDGQRFARPPLLHQHNTISVIFRITAAFLPRNSKSPHCMHLSVLTGQNPPVCNT
jgi:hypothetical protein